MTSTKKPANKQRRLVRQITDELLSVNYGQPSAEMGDRLAIKKVDCDGERDLGGRCRRVIEEVILRYLSKCLCCMTELSIIDEDPNGKTNPVCAKCRAEEAHDFDREPNARFDRGGRRIKAMQNAKLSDHEQRPSLTDAEWRNKLEQLVEIAKLAHALAVTANCSHPWAKDFKNRILVKISKLPRHIKDEIILSREDDERRHQQERQSR